MSFILLLGRILFSLNFILAAVGHWNKETIDWAAGLGVPMASILVPIAGIFAFLGGLSILLGYKARVGAWLLVIFLIPLTVMMTRFRIPNMEMAGMVQMWILLKNLSMLGAALIIAYFGSGPLSLDKKVETKSKKK